MNKTIFLVEDEPGLVLTMTDRLQNEGYRVKSVSDGRKAVEQAVKTPFDLMILDLMLPNKSGFDVCRDIRQAGVTSPILMLTARGDVSDKVVGLKLGADDYLTKPFEMVELLARIEALLRRGGGSSGNYGSQQRFQFGDVEVDFVKMDVIRKGKRIELSAREFQLLRYLIEQRGAMLSREKILNGVWGYDAMPSTRTVDTHIAWLRQKLEPNPHHPMYILTVHGVGYKFVG